MDEVEEMVRQEVYISVLVVKAPFGRAQILSMNEKLAAHNFTLVQTLVFPSLRGDGNEWAFHLFIQAGHVWRWTPSELKDRNYFNSKDVKRDRNGKILRDENGNILQDRRPPDWNPYTDRPGRFDPYAQRVPETHILGRDDGSLDRAAHGAAVQDAMDFFRGAVLDAHGG